MSAGALSQTQMVVVAGCGQWHKRESIHSCGLWTVAQEGVDPLLRSHSVVLVSHGQWTHSGTLLRFDALVRFGRWAVDALLLAAVHCLFGLNGHRQ